MKQRIYFRADAGREIGYGHFIRTLALADMLKDDFDCVFVTQSPTVYQKTEVAKVCELAEVPATEEKFSLFLDMLDGDEIVVLDNYFYDTDYQRAVKTKGCKLVCIDDMHDKHYVADVVINHSPGISEVDFSTAPYTRLCLGVSYALLRKPFLEVAGRRYRHAVDYRALKVIVSFGGVDKYNLTRRYIECLKDCDTIRSVTALTGDAYGDDRKIRHPKVNYLQNLSAREIAGLFCENDVALLPASTIMKEALACNLKVIGGYFVDNQLNSFKSFEAMKAIVGGGDYCALETEIRIRKLFSDSGLQHIELKEDIIPSSIAENLLAVFKSV